MKLALSNIAWDVKDDDAVGAVMREHGITALEVAPTKRWAKPAEATRSQAREWREAWLERGIELVAMQALLFGRPDLQVFGSRDAQQETLDYLAIIARLGAWLGIGPMVFGSPKNRRKGPLTDVDAFEHAVAFFREAGWRAAEYGTVLCLEPNPTQYDCDFVTESAAGRALVEAVDHPGFRLHLDAAGMTMAGEAPAAVAKASHLLAHFHASEPMLAPLGEGGVNHAGFAATLRTMGYQGYVSVEMRDPGRPVVAEIDRVLRFLTATYA